MANNENNLKKYISLTRLSDFLDNIKAKYSQIGHKHTTSDLTDYKVDTVLSSTSTNPVQNKVIDAEFDAISTSMGALDLAIDGKADASHDHNDKYYTETEIDTKLSNKANVSHSHNDLYYTESEVDELLGDKSDTSHTHTKADIGLGNVENKSSATIRGELTKDNVITALGYEPSSTTCSAITNEEIDEICNGGITTFLETISSEGVSF